MRPRLFSGVVVLILYLVRRGGAVSWLHQESKASVEFTLAGTSLLIPLEDRAGVLNRFVRLESSRICPGGGFGRGLVNELAQRQYGLLAMNNDRSLVFVSPLAFLRR